MPKIPDATILWVASEAIPWASTGGLADVVGSLPAVLRAQGWDVRLCLPDYALIHRRALSPPMFTFTLPVAAGLPPVNVSIRQAVDPPGGVPTYLVDCGGLFSRVGVYGEGGGNYFDNPYRYALFQLATRELAARLQPVPAIIHCHDWHTGLLPTLLHVPGQRPAALAETRTIFTIHNLQFQGDTGPELLDALALPRRVWHPEWAEHFGRLIPMKAGINGADRVTTVSPTYAAEIRGSARGFGLDGVLRERGTDVRGILNGIDYAAWNPAADSALAAGFSVDDVSGRAACKAALRAECGLPGGEAEPVIGFIGRFTSEKGVDLIAAALPDILATGAKVVILGTGDPLLERRMADLAARDPQRVATLLRFDSQLARRIYAGVDLLLVPSRTEPCGLVQFYGLRYGAVPIAHAVGGLKDTIFEGKNGFTFNEPSAAALADAVRRATALFRARARFRTLQKRGMAQDWSWQRSAETYRALYSEVLSAPPRVRRPPPALEPVAGPLDYGPPLSPLLDSPSLRLLAQSSSVLFAYWELSERDLARGGELILEERPAGTYSSVAPAPLARTGEAWLTAKPQQAYRMLLRLPDGAVIALSNPIVTPPDGPLDSDEEVPAWLTSAIAVRLLDNDDADGLRWSEIFAAAARVTVPASRRGGAERGAPGEVSTIEVATITNEFDWGLSGSVNLSSQRTRPPVGPLLHLDLPVEITPASRAVPGAAFASPAATSAALAFPPGDLRSFP